MLNHVIASRRKSAVLTITGFLMIGLLGLVPSAWAQGRPARLLLKQQDAVQAFDFTTGRGYQIGTATGLLSGTTFVSFEFTPQAPPSASGEFPFIFTNKVVITDIDGDQIYFDNNGRGTFHLSQPGTGFIGAGGPLTGSYVVTGGTGKYGPTAWRVGTTFNYRGIATNPPTGTLGTVYVEVSFIGDPYYQ